jgi:hypothetical protein
MSKFAVSYFAPIETKLISRKLNTRLTPGTEQKSNMGTPNTELWQVWQSLKQATPKSSKTLPTYKYISKCWTESYFYSLVLDLILSTKKA